MARGRPSWSGDPPEESTNGAIRRPHASEQALTESEQTLSESEQTLSDSEQTLSDTDQTSGERDQTSADSDQAASDRDQAASDRDLAHGVDPREHEASREIRRQTALEREQTGSTRLEGAQQRDADHERDDALAVTGAELIVRGAEQRKRARDYRAQAAQHRAQAVRDRQAAAVDREQGARDRLQALADREALACALAITEMDPLTGARTRAAGLADLDRELDRSRRTSSTLVVVYVDVVGLKKLNDSEGHAAGDRLLTRVVVLLTDHLRPYDLIVRLAGDEFLCAMSNMTLSDARRRFSAIAVALASSKAGALRTGFAELTGEETAAELIMRADSQLIDSHRGH